jgi:ribokinase
MASEIVVVGACMFDLISYVPRFAKTGETLHGSEFKMGYGGKGANQAVMAAKLGSAVKLISKLGDDFFGRGTQENLKQLNVDVAHLYFTDQALSGVAPITVAANGENSVIIVSGANNLLTENEIEAARDQIAQAKYLLCQLEIDLKLTKKALEIAKAEGVKTILNPAPAVEQLPAEIYKLVDVFCPNETETEILTKGSTKSLSEAKAQAKVLLARGVKTVIITLGERGCLIVDNEGDTHIPAPAVKAIDTVGAGDCFVGSLAHFLAKGLTMPAAAHRAVTIASLSVQAKGTQTSFPEAKDLPRELIEI